MKIRKLLLSLLILLLTSSVALAASPLCLYGTPKGSDGKVVDHVVYELCNNRETKFADWIAYIVSPETIAGSGKTTRCWKADPLLSPAETLEPADYKGAHAVLHTDRGHQAPLASFKGTSCWAETNYLSNITPQCSELNQGPWRLLEEHVRDLARQGSQVYVMTGPLYERPMPALPGADEPHRVPSGYWKICVIQDRPGDPASLRCQAWILDQETPRKADYRAYSTSINEVERQAGLDVLWELDDSIEEQIENRVDREIKAAGIAAAAMAPQVKIQQKEPEAAPGEIIVYITKSGSKYHREGCSCLRKSCIPITLAEAKAKGYGPCKRCRPEE